MDFELNLNLPGALDRKRVEGITDDSDMFQDLMRATKLAADGEHVESQTVLSADDIPKSLEMPPPPDSVKANQASTVVVGKMTADFLDELRAQGKDLGDVPQPEHVTLRDGVVQPTGMTPESMKDAKRAKYKSMAAKEDVVGSDTPGSPAEAPKRKKVTATIRETGHDSMRYYLKSMGNHDLLKKNEEIILAREIQILIGWESKRVELEAQLAR